MNPVLARFLAAPRRVLAEASRAAGHAAPPQGRPSSAPAQATPSCTAQGGVAELTTVEPHERRAESGGPVSFNRQVGGPPRDDAAGGGTVTLDEVIARARARLLGGAT